MNKKESKDDKQGSSNGLSKMIDYGQIGFEKALLEINTNFLVNHEGNFEINEEEAMSLKIEPTFKDGDMLKLCKIREKEQGVL